MCVGWSQVLGEEHCFWGKMPSPPILQLLGPLLELLHLTTSPASPALNGTQWGLSSFPQFLAFPHNSPFSSLPPFPSSTSLSSFSLKNTDPSRSCDFKVPPEEWNKYSATDIQYLHLLLRKTIVFVAFISWGPGERNNGTFSFTLPQNALLSLLSGGWQTLFCNSSLQRVNVAAWQRDTTPLRRCKTSPGQSTGDPTLPRALWPVLSLPLPLDCYHTAETTPRSWWNSVGLNFSIWSYLCV